MNSLFYKIFRIAEPYNFSFEISLIDSLFIRDIVTTQLTLVPDYFWKIPASSTGKYHPKYALGRGGLVRHVRATIKIAQELFRMEEYTFNRYEKDIIIAALILHDTFKSGVEDSGFTVTNHPLLIAQALREVFCTVPDGNMLRKDAMDAWLRKTRIVEDICKAVRSHMGQWTKDKEGNEILPKPETKVEKFVHLCDYIASRKFLEVNFNA